MSMAAPTVEPVEAREPVQFDLTAGVRTLARLARIAEQACLSTGISLPQYRLLVAVSGESQRASALAARVQGHGHDALGGRSRRATHGLPDQGTQHRARAGGQGGEPAAQGGEGLTGSRVEITSGIGSQAARYQAIELTLGDKDYVDDMFVPGMLHGAVRLADHARAEILRIDTSRATAEPGVAAVITAVLVMMVAAGPISDFVEEHPTVKMLALAFLILIGFTLMGEGLDLHTPKGYIYFAMAFSFGVEMLNIRAKRKRADHVRLRKAQLADIIEMEGSPGNGDRA